MSDEKPAKKSKAVKKTSVKKPKGEPVPAPAMPVNVADVEAATSEVEKEPVMPVMPVIPTEVLPTVIPTDFQPAVASPVEVSDKVVDASPEVQAAIEEEVAAAVPVAKKSFLTLATAAAALLSAVGGTGWSVSKTEAHEDAAAKVQQSILAVMEYRLSVVEKSCGVKVAETAPVFEGFGPRVVSAKRPHLPMAVPPAPPAPVVQNIPSFQEIEKLAHEGKTWVPPAPVTAAPEPVDLEIPEAAASEETAAAPPVEEP